MKQVLEKLRQMWRKIPPGIRKPIPYVLAYIVLFNLIATVTATEHTGFLWFWTLLIFYPLCSIGVSVVFTIKHGFKWFFALFAPLVFIIIGNAFIDDAPYIYIALYLVSSLIGQGLGAIVRLIKLRKHTK